MKRRFNDKSRGIAKRKRKPVMFISLEGNNKTEKYYLISLNKDTGNMLCSLHLVVKPIFGICGSHFMIS